MSSSYLTPFPNLTFKTVFVASLSRNRHEHQVLLCDIFASFAVTSTSFFNSSIQANVVSRVEIDPWNFRLVDLFLLASSRSKRTRTSCSTIQMTPVLKLTGVSYPEDLIKTLKNSTYFSRSFKQLAVRIDESRRLFPALENLVALEVLYIRFGEGNWEATEEERFFISRLPSLTDLSLVFDRPRDKWQCFNFLGDVENNNGFRKLAVEFCCGTRSNFLTNLARLCAKNFLTHLSLLYLFGDDDLDVLIGAKLTNLQSLELLTRPSKENCNVSVTKIADAVIACSTSLTTLELNRTRDEDLIKCAEHLDKLVELRLNYSFVDGSFLREKGSCFASRLEILHVSWWSLCDENLDDGFKHLTSLRKLNVFGNHDFTGAESLPFLTAATSLEELKLGENNGASLKAVGQLSQLRCLHVGDVDKGIKVDDVVHLKKLVNLRTLIFYNSTKEIYDGIFKIAECFPKLGHIDLAYNAGDKSKRPEFSRDQVVYLLEQCWPHVRYAKLKYKNPTNTMPFLRGRFPHVNFGDRDEEVARKNGAINSSLITVPACRQRSF